MKGKPYEKNKSWKKKSYIVWEIISLENIGLIFTIIQKLGVSKIFLKYITTLFSI